MGAVYEAVQHPLGRRVAVKVISAKLASEHVYLERFRREAAAAAQLGHANIVQVTDFGTDAETGLAYLAMELLNGQPLLTLVRGGPVAEERACNITLQLLSALEAAHERGIVHRDLKPANVFLVPIAAGGELVKLLDFGIAKLMDSSTWSRLTETGMLIGTPRYSAPEQIDGKNVGPRTDLHAVGVLLYCMLAGRPPFTSSGAHLLVDIQQNEAPAPNTFVPGLSPGVVAFVHRAMRKRPEERFHSAREMADALSSALSRRTTADPAAAARREVPEPTEAAPIGDDGSRGPEPSGDMPHTAVGAWGTVPPTVHPAPAEARPPPVRAAAVASKKQGAPLLGWLALAAAAGLLGLLIIAGAGGAYWFLGRAEEGADSRPSPLGSDPGPPVARSEGSAARPALTVLSSGPLPRSCLRQRYELCVSQPGSAACLDFMRMLDVQASLSASERAARVAGLDRDCQQALLAHRQSHPPPPVAQSTDYCSPRCDPAEFCMRGSCEMRPLMVIETPSDDGCVDLGQSHVAPAFAHRIRYFGRPGVATVRTLVNASCNASPTRRPGPTLDAQGAGFTAEFEARDSPDCGAPRQIYAAVELSFTADGERSNLAYYTNYNSTCPGDVRTCGGVRAAGCGEVGPVR